MGYARSPVRDFENYFRMLIGLDDKKIQLTLKHYNSCFITYEIPTGIYTSKDISEAIYKMGDH